MGKYDYGDNMVYGLDSLLKHVVDSVCGDAVGDQFKDTWSGREPFEEQNPNALEMIKETLEGILGNNLLNDENQKLTQKYYDRLTDALYRWDEEEDDDDDDDEISENPINEQKEKILKDFKRFL